MAVCPHCKGTGEAPEREALTQRIKAVRRQIGASNDAKTVLKLTGELTDLLFQNHGI